MLARGPTAASPTRQRGPHSHAWATPKRYVTPKKDFPTALNTAAIALALTDKQLGTLLGIRRDTARQWRNGRRNASAAALATMAELLNQRMAELDKAAKEIAEARAKKEAAQGGP